MAKVSQDRIEQLRQIILPVAIDAFATNGIRAVKMDDIASSLKMSKRTLYEAYDNKKELFLDAMKAIMDEFHQHMMTFASTDRDVMDILLEFFKKQFEIYAKINPQFFADLHRYPELLEEIRKMRKIKVDSGVVFCMKGVKEGYFRDDVNYELLMRIGRDVSQMTREKTEYSSYDVPEFFYTYVCTILRGVCTERGLAKIDEFIGQLKK